MITAESGRCVAVQVKDNKIALIGNAANSDATEETFSTDEALNLAVWLLDAVGRSADMEEPSPVPPERVGHLALRVLYAKVQSLHTALKKQDERHETELARAAKCAEGTASLRGGHGFTARQIGGIEAAMASAGCSREQRDNVIAALSAVFGSITPGAAEREDHSFAEQAEAIRAGYRQSKVGGAEG